MIRKFADWFVSSSLLKQILTAMVPVAVAAVGAYFLFREKQEVRVENQHFERGTTSERLEGNAEVVNNVKKANEATANPNPGELERVRSKYDRCRVGSEDCQ